MLAIDLGLVVDTRGGRYRSTRSAADEVLFWEGHKSKSRRSITLWLEPVITFAALARLHVAYGWPKDSLGMQPKGAFDFAAFEQTTDQVPRILGEVKKSSQELSRLREELLNLSNGAALKAISNNSSKKWQSLLATRPRTLWLLGPNEESHVYEPSYFGNSCTLQEVKPSDLARSAA